MAKQRNQTTAPVADADAEQIALATEALEASEAEGPLTPAEQDLKATIEAIATPEPEAAPVATFSPCECGCGLPARRRFVVGHDARKHAADALAARAAADGLTLEAQATADAEARKAKVRAKGAAKRAAEKAEYEAAMAAALAVKAETPEATAEALTEQAAREQAIAA